MEPAMALPNAAAVTAGTWDFSTLVRQHQSMVFSLAYYFLRERGTAEELAQDVFLQLYRHLEELQSEEHVVFWLRRVTANRCIDAARRRQRRPEVALDDAPDPVAPAFAGDPLLGERLRRLVASLPEKARMVVLLRYQEDLDPDEIASLLGMPVNTVKSQLHRALIMLRQKAEGLNPAAGEK
jgi:RNA polymerase sigma-70 factor (ECF subfamily)